MNFLKKITTLSLCLLVAFSSFAETPNWGATGHRVVGEIANSYLTCKAKRKIRKILGTESVAISSNWADFIKSENAMRHLDIWHYINIKSGKTYDEFNAQLKTDTVNNAFNRINFMVDELKNKRDLTLEQKRFRLRMLIHIVGDIHQPMHVGRAEDRGGNDIKVQWFSEPTNLHAVWDDKLIEFQKLSYTEYTANINHADKAQRLAWQKQPLSMWFFESYQSAEKVYAGITQPDQRLSYRYNYDNVELLNQQLLKAGVRLAGLLNDIFG